ncbi:hypothetical protein CHELA1G11_12762 [Hyphomicrobiales bacterium]|nr:hypothetical protein CHELA1G2_11544 [Hyphomicrobiales bacterium]CAH1666948.1 hypothetical protein CHELA1G11_12762 [Hyphomicrobiales bacterium]
MPSSFPDLPPNLPPAAMDAVSRRLNCGFPGRAVQSAARIEERRAGRVSPEVSTHANAVALPQTGHFFVWLTNAGGKAASPSALADHHAHFTWPSGSKSYRVRRPRGRASARPGVAWVEKPSSNVECNSSTA